MWPAPGVIANASRQFFVCLPSETPFETQEAHIEMVCLPFYELAGKWLGNEGEIKILGDGVGEAWAYKYAV